MPPKNASNGAKDPDEVEEQPPQPSSSLVTEISGDLFDAPDGSGLIHACNAQGGWGKGIAKIFKERYPAAYRAYWSHCLKFSDKPPLHAISDLTSESGGTVSVPYPDGTALLIPPQLVDYDRSPNGKKHWIICLFTSNGYGARVDSPAVIINKTAAALYDLKQQLHEMGCLSSDIQDNKIKCLFACRFNSGLFRVPWAKTLSVIEKVGIGLTVVIPNEGMPKEEMQKLRKKK